MPLEQKITPPICKRTDLYPSSGVQVSFSTFTKEINVCMSFICIKGSFACKDIMNIYIKFQENLFKINL